MANTARLNLAALTDVLRKKLGSFTTALFLGSAAVWLGFIGVSTADTLQRQLVRAREARLVGKSAKGALRRRAERMQVGWSQAAVSRGSG